LVFEEAGGAAGDGEPGEWGVFGGELAPGFGLEDGAVVAVGEQMFEAVEFGLFLRCSVQGVFLGLDPPGGGFGEAHRTAGTGIGGEEQQRLPGRWGRPADLDGELQGG
jgi:hypothetical protein